MTTLAQPDARSASKRERWQAFNWLRSNSARPGARQCYTPREGVGTVKVGVTPSGVVHVEGIKRCGSVWGCPLCAPVIREARAVLLDQLLGRALDAGCEIVFVTATASHHTETNFGDLWDAMQASWSYAFAGRSVQDTSVRTDVVQRPGTYEVRPQVVELGGWYMGQARAFDLTHGGNGWHPHIHAVIVLSGRTSEYEYTPPRAQRVNGGTTGSSRTLTGVAARDRWLRDRRDRYRESMKAFGFDVAADHRGWDVRPVRRHSRSGRAAATAVAGYMAKVEGGWGAAHEMARSDRKSARRPGGRTAFAILRDAVAGDGRSRDLFREYEQVTAGKQLLVVGRRLGVLFGVDVTAKSDQELVDVTPDEPMLYGVEIAVDEWLRLLQSGHLVDLLLHLAECAHELVAAGRGPPPALAAA